MEDDKNETWKVFNFLYCVDFFLEDVKELFMILNALKKLLLCLPN